MAVYEYLFVPSRRPSVYESSAAGSRRDLRPSSQGTVRGLLQLLFRPAILAP